MAGSNKCIACGVDIPEGRQICPACENGNTHIKSHQESLYDALLKYYMLEQKIGNNGPSYRTLALEKKPGEKFSETEDRLYNELRKTEDTIEQLVKLLKLK